jgi:hypothetical protein
MRKSLTIPIDLQTRIATSGTILLLTLSGIAGLTAWYAMDTTLWHFVMGEERLRFKLMGYPYRHLIGITTFVLTRIIFNFVTGSSLGIVKVLNAISDSYFNN